MSWQDGTHARGGRVLHTIARGVWALFGLFGALAMVVLAIVYTADPGPEASDNGVVGNFIGSLIVFVPLGAAAASVLGLVVQFSARTWLRNAPPVESKPQRERREAAERANAEGLDPDGPWARRYESCLRSATAYRTIVDTVTEDAAREWFERVGATLDAELDEALRLAKLGQLLDGREGGEPSPTGARAASLLDDAERSFADTAERAAAIALDLRDESDFVRVKAQLDMLAEQAPHLRDAGDI